MYSIIFSLKSQDTLDVFINSYEKSFTSLYIDSGITDRDIIIKNYKDLGGRFKSIILEKIQHKLQTERVLGRKINSENNYSLIFSERSFLIIIDYTEETSSKTRFIENIIFTKK